MEEKRSGQTGMQCILRFRKRRRKKKYRIRKIKKKNRKKEIIF